MRTCKARIFGTDFGGSASLRTYSRISVAISSLSIGKDMAFGSLFFPCLADTRAVG